jgi:hypothetical protein
MLGQTAYIDTGQADPRRTEKDHRPLKTFLWADGGIEMLGRVFSPFDTNRILWSRFGRYNVRSNQD